MNVGARLVVWATVGGLVACKPPGAAVPDEPQEPARSSAPTHEPMDVRVINASRGEDFRGAAPTDVMWTGTEAALVFTSPGRLMERLWVGRMDGEGKLLERRQVELPQEVSGHLYPRWVDGAISSVYNTGLTDHWIRVSLDGKVLGIAQIPEAEGQHVMGANGDMHPSGRFALESVLGDVVPGVPTPTQIDLFEGQARPTATIRVACEIVGDVVATDWGYAIACEDEFTRDTEALTSKIIGVRSGRVAWQSPGLPSGRS